MPINDTVTSGSYNAKTSLPTISSAPVDSAYDSATVEVQAKKILTRIPDRLKSYIPHAILDFYKQVEEYEQWKQSTANFYLNSA